MSDSYKILRAATALRIAQAKVRKNKRRFNRDPTTDISTFVLERGIPLRQGTTVVWNKADDPIKTAALPTQAADPAIALAAAQAKLLTTPQNRKAQKVVDDAAAKTAAAATAQLRQDAQIAVSTLARTNAEAAALADSQKKIADQEALDLIANTPVYQPSNQLFAMTSYIESEYETKNVSSVIRRNTTAKIESEVAAIVRAGNPWTKEVNFDVASQAVKNQNPGGMDKGAIKDMKKDIVQELANLRDQPFIDLP
jgi:hypothetical protein